MYVTSFKNFDDANSVDKILIFNGKTGQFLYQIALWQPEPGANRAFAQALLFGPGGDLYVPITGGSPETTGELRVYHLTTKMFTLLAKAGGPLQQPFYLTFCGTNPATLAYKLLPHCACGQ